MRATGNVTLLRLLSGLLGLPVYAYLILTDQFKSIPVLIGSIIISLICLYEFYQITNKENEGKAFVPLGITAGLFLNIVIYLFAFGKVYGYGRYITSFDSRVIIGILLLLLSIVFIIQIFRRPIKGGIYSISVTLFGIMYIVLSFSHIILIKALADGIYYLIFLNIVIMMNDIGAYTGGMLFGKHKVKLPVSPNKSWEGYFSGLLLGMVSMIVVNQIFITFYNRKLFTQIEAVVIGILLSILGSIGDLVESAIKRDCAIKDSGSIIPGHGGMWDVFDAMIFTLPAFYYYLVLSGVS